MEYSAALELILLSAEGMVLRTSPVTGNVVFTGPSCCLWNPSLRSSRGHASLRLIPASAWAWQGSWGRPVPGDAGHLGHRDSWHLAQHSWSCSAVWASRPLPSLSHSFTWANASRSEGPPTLALDPSFPSQGITFTHFLHVYLCLGILRTQMLTHGLSLLILGSNHNVISEKTEYETLGSTW